MFYFQWWNERRQFCPKVELFYKEQAIFSASLATDRIYEFLLRSGWWTWAPVGVQDKEPHWENNLNICRKRKKKGVVNELMVFKEQKQFLHKYCYSMEHGHFINTNTISVNITGNKWKAFNKTWTFIQFQLKTFYVIMTLFFFLLMFTQHKAQEPLKIEGHWIMLHENKTMR